MFTRFVDWCKFAWNPYTDKELQNILQRKIKNEEYGIQLPWQTKPMFDLADEMEVLLATICSHTIVANNTKGDDQTQQSMIEKGDNQTQQSVIEKGDNSINVNNFGNKNEQNLQHNDLAFSQQEDNTENSRKRLDFPSGRSSSIEKNPFSVVNIGHLVQTDILDAETYLKEDINSKDSDCLSQYLHILENINIQVDDVPQLYENDVQLDVNTSANGKDKTETKLATSTTQTSGESLVDCESDTQADIKKPVVVYHSSKKTKSMNEENIPSADKQRNRSERHNGEKFDLEIKMDNVCNDEKEPNTSGTLSGILKSEHRTSLEDMNISENEKGEILSSDNLRQQSRTKSVTWEKSVTNGHEGIGDSVDEKMSSCNQFDESSEKEVLTQHDLAYGNEGFAHYSLFVKIEKREQIGEINDERKRLRELYTAKKDMIRDMIRIARAYYTKPSIKAVKEWKELKRGVEMQGKSDTDVKIKFAKLPEFLPFFTIIVTLAQLVTCVVLCVLGGQTVIGVVPNVEHRDGIQTFLGTETVHKWVIPNLWIGPSDRYMISVGAFFAPCLRDDIDLQLRTIEHNYSIAEPLGCCEMASRNTAATTTMAECHDLTQGIGLWRENTKCGERKSGENSVTHNLKPCCYNINGYCKLTTHQHCIFLGGIYYQHSVEHCSQVNCLSSICGMGGLSHKTDQPWLPESPTQWWRLLLSLIYHHGIIHVILIGVLQVLIMRIMEKSIGWLRIMIVYIFCGVGGILAASVFEPHYPRVGATGSVCGLLGVTIVEILLLWKLINKPWIELIKIFAIIILFLLIGTLPYISNYTVITGLILGICLSVLVLPYVTCSRMSARLRIVLIATCVPLILAIYFVLVFVFVKVQTITKCYICKLITCVPYADNMCQDEYEE